MIFTEKHCTESATGTDRHYREKKKERETFKENPLIMFTSIEIAACANNTCNDTWY